eukprot:Skav214648  [mRNA]  locus=scaffold1660:52599:54713:- [translate_table: standard]
MGDLNAVDIAQQVHLEILKDCHCMQPEEVLEFKSPVPASHTFEGLYIDDHIVAQVVPGKKLRPKKQKFRDDEIIEDSRRQYETLGIPTSSNKAFNKEPRFTAWGTEVDSKTGRVGAPLQKMRQLADILAQACRLPKLSKKLLQGLTGLLVHPFMHRRLAMSLLQDTFLWIERLKDNESKPLPVSVREELLGCALILPLCHSNIRWGVSTRVGASDASSHHGGRAACLVSQPIANTLYRFSEHRGEHIRLDWVKGGIQPVSQMERAPPELEQLVQDLPWNETEPVSFSHAQHINILETRMIHRELEDVVMKCTKPLRCVLLVDSRAAAGAWSKGRSSAKNLNRILRKSLGWSLIGRKTLHLVWVRSGANPSDYPSRKRKIPPPPEVASENTKLAFGDELPAYRVRRSNRDIWREVNSKGGFTSVCSSDGHDPRRAAVRDTSSRGAAKEVPQNSGQGKGESRSEHPALAHWSFREIFAGTGHLTRTFRTRGKVSVQPPFEVYRKGKYNSAGDILDDHSFNQLCKDACRPRQYWHFGFPCGSFSLMQNMNKGTRSRDNPLGTGKLKREIIGNEIMHRTIHLCHLLHKHGSLFTLENPLTSYAWVTPAMLDLIHSSGAQQVVFDQCRYGLHIPKTEDVMGLALKPTKMVGTLPNMFNLNRRCSHQHEHVAVIGGVKHQGKWQKRSHLAGAYPVQLCTCIAKTFEKAFA